MAMSPARVAAAATLAASILIAPWEGEENVGYLDIGGVPTYCFGQTGKDAVVGKYYPPAVCRAKLNQSALAHAQEINRCIHVEVPAYSHAAFISFAYNFGAPAFCGSTIAKKLNRGDLAGACRQLTTSDTGKIQWSYIKVGRNPDGSKRFKFVKGLENRRKDERRVCEKGLSDAV